MKKTFKQTQPVSLEQALIALVKDPSKRFFADRYSFLSSYPYYILFTNEERVIGTDIVESFTSRTTMFNEIEDHHRNAKWFEVEEEVDPLDVIYDSVIVVYVGFHTKLVRSSDYLKKSANDAFEEIEKKLVQTIYAKNKHDDEVKVIYSKEGSE